MRAHTAWPGSRGLSRWLHTITALGDDYNLVREMAHEHTGPQYKAISAKFHPGDWGNFFGWAVRDHMMASWFLDEGEIHPQGHHWNVNKYPKCPEEREKNAPNISLLLLHNMHRTRDLIPDWAPLAMSLPTATPEVTSPGNLGMELTGSRSDRCEGKVQTG